MTPTKDQAFIAKSTFYRNGIGTVCNNLSVANPYRRYRLVGKEH